MIDDNVKSKMPINWEGHSLNIPDKNNETSSALLMNAPAGNQPALCH